MIPMLCDNFCCNYRVCEFQLRSLFSINPKCFCEGESAKRNSSDMNAEIITLSSVVAKFNEHTFYF